MVMVSAAILPEVVLSSEPENRMISVSGHYRATPEAVPSSAGLPWLTIWLQTWHPILHAVLALELLGVLSLWLLGLLVVPSLGRLSVLLVAFQRGPAYSVVDERSIAQVALACHPNMHETAGRRELTMRRSTNVNAPVETRVTGWKRPPWCFCLDERRGSSHGMRA